jgi:glycosyltransferase involved in cell wall biosynthesis
MIGVVIPAHNEVQDLPECLRSIALCARHPELQGEIVRVMVVLDACTDGTEHVLASYDVENLAVNVRSVGAARSAGANAMLLAGARWLAFTDADSRVPPDWLVAQLRADSDAVCGTVTPDDWHDHPPLVRQRYELGYQLLDGHPHVHGANLGVSAHAYLLAGGFPHWPAHEDVGLVDRLMESGARIARLARPCVVTSARKIARAPEGFASFLRSLEGAHS